MEQKLRKPVAWLLTLAMLITMLPSFTFTALAVDNDNLCAHHTEHTAECGYVESVSDCTYHCDVCLGHEHGEGEPEDLSDPAAECTCAEHCTADSFNEYCEVCGVDYTKCTGTDTAALYEGNYTITVNESENGTVAADLASAAEGTEVTLTVTPAEGYELGRLIVTNLVTTDETITPTLGEDGTYTFAMPAGNVTVNAVFTAKCTCDTKCDEGSPNAECEVCVADLTACVGMAQTESGSIDLSTLTETYVISDSGEYTFTGTGSYGIKVESGNPGIVLNNAIIELDDGDYFGSPVNGIHIASTSGTTTIQVVGESSITAEGGAGIFVAEGGTVKITGNSREDVLTVVGAQGSSGIGGYAFLDEDYDAFYIDCGNITIDNVTVYTRCGELSNPGDMAPGIGSAGSATCGVITINNAVVYAYGAELLMDDYGAPAIGSGFPYVLSPTSIPTVIINNSSIHTYRSNSCADYIGWAGDRMGITDATGSINCGEDGSVTNSTIYCYTGPNATTTDKTVKYGALGGLLKEDGTCEGEHSGGTQTCMGYKCANCGNWYGENNDNHDWSNKDGICARECGAECAHKTYTEGVCDVCGYVCTHENGTLGTPVPTEDGKHTATYSCCGLVVTEDHSFVGGKCVCGVYEITIGNVTAKNFDGTDRVWQSGDTIKVDVWDKDNGGYERTTLTYDGTSWGSIITDVENPVVAAAAGKSTYVWFTNGNYNVDVSMDQMEGSVDDYDMMFAYNENVNSGTRLDLQFERLFAKLTFNIEYDIEAGETPPTYYFVGFDSQGSLNDRVVISGVQDGNPTKVYSPTEAHSVSAPINYGDADDHTDDKIEVVVGDGTIPAGTEFIWFFKTYDDANPLKVKVPLSGWTFEIGKAYEFDILITSEGASLQCKGEHSISSYTDNGNGTHTGTCSACDNTVTEAHNHTNGKCVCGLKATPTVTAPTAVSGLEYNGTAQALVTAGGTTGGTMQYKLGENGTYGTAVPEATDAGTYTVYYKVVGNDNYMDVAEQPVSVTIAPKSITITGATIEDVLYREDGQYTLNVTGVEFGGLVNNEDLTIDTGYTATATVSNNTVGTVAATVTVTLNNGDYSLAVATYETTVNIVEHTHVWSYSAKDNVITATCSGTIGNCPVADKTVTITLNKPNELTYDGAEKTVTVTQSPEGVFTDVPAEIKGNWINAGTYTAEYTYGEVKATLNFTIEKASISTVSVNVTAPVALANKQTTVDGGTGYTAAIAWDTDAAAFGFNTAYTATVTLTADSNHKFAEGITVEGWTVQYSESKLTLTKTFDATRKAKLTELTDAPADVTLTDYYTDAAGAIAELPTTVTYNTESGPVTVAIEWNCADYNSATKAENTFAWSVKAGELDNYDANSILTTGEITVTNVDALPVTNSGADQESTYNGGTFDVAAMFTKDTNAGAASYAIVEGGTGAGTLDGSVLTITKAGTITIKLTTAAKDPYAEGEATATLTVKKADPTVSEPTGLTATYGDTLKAVALTDGWAWDNALTTSVGNAGTNTFSATFTPENTDLYNTKSAELTITVAKASISGATVTVDETADLTYTGTAIEPAVTVTLNGTELTKNDYDLVYNSNTNAGQATVTVTGKGNYKDSANTTFIISKAAAPAIQWPTASGIVYGQKLSASVLTSADENGTFAWKNGDTVPTVLNSGYVVVYTPKDTANYDYTGVTLENTIEVSVTAADQADFSISGATTAKYGDPAITLNAAGGSGEGAITWEITSGDAFAEITGNGATATLTIKGVGAVTVKATKASDGNYNAKVDTHEITISKATVTASDFTYTEPTDLIYSKTAKTAGVTGDAAYGAITIHYYSNSEMTNAVTEPINVGTYYVGITTAGGDNYNAVTAPMYVGSFTITARPVTVTANAQSMKYGEDVPELTYTHNLIAGDSFTGSLATDAAKTSDVGEYDITIGDLANSNYTINFTGAKLTITKADGPAAPTVTGSYTHDGMTYTYTVNAIEGAEYSKDGSTWQDSNVFTELSAGQKYTFYARIKETRNVNVGAIGQSAGVDLSKLPGNGTVTIAGWTYGETAKAPVTNSTTGNSVASCLYESTDGKGYSSETAPTDAGEYRLTVTFAATDTHNGTTAYADFTIAKATPNVTAPTGLIATYGDTLASVQLTEGWAWKDATATEVGNAGENTFTVIYTKDNSGNYNTVEKTVTITVSPKTVTAAVTVAGENFIFNGSEQKPGVTVKDGETTIPESEYTVTYKDNTNAGTATVIVTDKDGGNYTVSGTTTFVIAKKASSALSGVEREFMRTIATTGNEIDVAAMLPDNRGTTTYTITSSGYAVLESVSVDADGKLVFDTKTSDTAASDTITVKVEMQNYTDVTLTVSVILNEKTPQNITGVTATEGLIYNGNAQQGYTGTPASEKYTGAYEITYTGRDNSYNSSVAPTNAGEYTVTFKIPDTDLYYSGNVSVNFTIGKAQATVTADDKEAYIGSRMPELTYKVSGLIGEDTISVELSCDANMNRAGETPIVVTATDPNGNYEITTVNGTLTVKYYPYIPAPTYPPVVDSGDNGDVTVSPKNPEKGDTVIITPDPDAGYEVDEIVVTDKNGNPVEVIDNGDGTYSFKQPSGKVNIEVTFKKIVDACPGDKSCPMYGYTDLDRTAWYHDGVHFCIENKLMNGISATEFAPGTSLSRAMLVTILWRLEGEPVVNYAMSFDDVAAGTWYTEAIRWAASEGIVNGYSDTAFGPNDNITREQLATILYRYEQKNGGGFTGAWMIRMDYVDLADVSDWAYEAMCWMNMNAVINGKPGKVLDPKGTATRAEAATMLQRYCELSGKDEET